MVLTIIDTRTVIKNNHNMYLGSMYLAQWLLFALTYISISVGVTNGNQVSFSQGKDFEEYTDKSLLWAPYRSNCYFGIRPRNVNQSPFIFGLMWFDNSQLNSLNNLRHFVEQGDKLTKYGWEVYDPRLGGKEVFIDEYHNLNLTVYFTKNHEGDNWAVRIKGEPLDKEKNTATSIVMYFNQNGEDGVSKLSRTSALNNDLKFEGYSKEMGGYELGIIDNYGEYYFDPNLETMEITPGCDSSKTSHVSLNVPDNNVWMAEEVFKTMIGDSVRDIIKEKNSEQIVPSLNPSVFTVRNIYDFPAGNFHFVQKTFNISNNKGFEVDITYNKIDSRERILDSKKIRLLIVETLREIKSRFKKHFKIPYHDEEMKTFALETLSNLLGGIGYFHGTQVVDRTTSLIEGDFQKIELKNGQEEGPLSLFTSVPSRAFFPRGFYWDEGFHLLQIMEYDFDLAFVIMSSWFNLIEENGWIPREVILGDEARSKVPPEFQTQNPNIANPPVLLLTFSEMLDRAIIRQENLALTNFKENENVPLDETSQLEENAELLLEYAKKIYPNLLRHYEWFRKSQQGLVDEWEEVLEDEDLLDEINKDEIYSWRGRTRDHCLPSGLDDYPRAQPPDTSELNVDALAWIGVMTRSMKKIAQVLKFEDDENQYDLIEKSIINNLEKLHWSEDDKCYCDLVLNDYAETREFICHKGYISLLPFALKLIPKDSPHLLDTIELLGDKEELFSDFGILSLSKQDEYFGTNENYWRGPIWININYICLDAIKYYYPEALKESTEGLNESSMRAKKIYDELKDNLITNVYRVWKENGYCYEAYNANNGNGKSTEHFTGWTALIVNIMGQQ